MRNFVADFAYRELKKKLTDEHLLNYLFWECTTRCNLDCRHCGSDCSKNSLLKDMPKTDFLKALDTIQDVPHNFMVVITGGEPLLRTDIEQCGMEIRKRGTRWSMVTNGYLYDERRHVSLLNAGLGALTISLDGLEDTHNWMRKNDDIFEKVVRAIELAASSPRLNFDVVTCVNSRNYSELEKLRLFLIEKGVKAWRLFTIVPIGRARFHPELFLSNEQFEGLMDFISVSRQCGQMDVKFSCEGYVGSYETKVRNSRFFCRAGINIGSILADGSISACPNTDRSLVQGNIYNDNFYEVWQSRFEVFRDRSWTRTGQCSTCKDYKNCEGNGIHNWHGDMKNVLVCHKNKIG